MVGTKTNNSDTLGEHRGSKEVDSGHMASGFHPVGSREPLEILIRSHMTLGTPGEMSAA